jgi:hypothetical protein
MSATITFKLGIEGKVYYCADGIGSTPTWVELTDAKDVNCSITKTESDATTRANGGWKATVTSLKDLTIEFEMVWNPSDTGCEAVKDAFINNTVLGMAVMDGPIATVGSEGPWADCQVTKFDRKEGNEGAMMVSVAMKPTYSANKPLWKKVAGA